MIGRHHSTTSATVGEMSATVGGEGGVRDSGGNVRISGVMFATVGKLNML